MNSKVIAGIVIAVVIIGGGIAWYSVSHGSSSNGSSADMSSQGTDQNSMSGSDAMNSQNPQGQPMQMASSSGGYRNMMANVPKGGFAGGTISAIGDSSITITMRDNTSKVVDFDSSTVFKKYDTGSASMIPATIDDMMVGQRIIAIGTPNADGSVQATMINEGMPMRQRMASSTPPAMNQSNSSANQ